MVAIVGPASVGAMVACEVVEATDHGDYTPRADGSAAGASSASG
jgi:hypothetical protein